MASPVTSLFGKSGDAPYLGPPLAGMFRPEDKTTSQNLATAGNPVQGYVTVTRNDLPILSRTTLLAKFPPPADYPVPNADPDVPLDAYLSPTTATRARYGGLPNNQWTWVSWRKAIQWGTGSDPGNNSYAVKLLSPREQSFIDADIDHSSNALTLTKVIAKYVGPIAVGALAAVGTVAAVGAAAPAAAAPEAGATVGAGGTATGGVITGGTVTTAATATGGGLTLGSVAAPIATAGVGIGVKTVTGLLTPLPKAPGTPTVPVVAPAAPETLSLSMSPKSLIVYILLALMALFVVASDNE